MPTPVFVCGAECGIAATGTASAGVEHWSAAGGGSISVVTSGPASMRSVRCFRVNPTATGSNTLTHTFAAAIASPATAVFRFYVYFASLPSTSVDLCTVISGAGAAAGAFYNSGEQSIAGGRGSTGSGGVSVTTGQWYRVDVKVVQNTTRTVDVQVNGVAATQFSEASAANTIVSVQVGTGTTSTCDHYLDDVYVSGTSGDFPIGAGMVYGVYPTADGTHGGGWASGVFGKGTSGGTNASTSDTDIWQSLDNPLVATAAGTWVSNKTATAVTNYVEFACDDLPADASTVQGAMMVATTHSASATANTFWLQGVYSGASTTYWNNVDLSETTITVPVVIDSNATTVARVNELVVRFSSNDSNPDVYLDGFCLETSITQTPITGPVSVKRGRNTRNQLALSRGGF